jgi:hypothetical protein
VPGPGQPCGASLLLGVVESDGVADGLDGTVISVGVGTGGRVRVGSCDGGTGARGADRATVGVAPLDGGVLTGAVVGVAAGEVALGVGAGRDEYSTAVTGPAVLACLGALPSPPAPPAPPGCATAACRDAGVASVQPAETAIGRPRARSPKKTDLGDNRTL